MHTMRTALNQLGWPVDELTDQQITAELSRRWLAFDTPEATATSANLSAAGIFARMARTGNLDALCWGAGDLERVARTANADRARPAETPELRRARQSDRRRAPRTPAHDTLNWCASGSSDSYRGWLVDYADVGVAFVADSALVPMVGSEIRPTILVKDEPPVQLGPAVVVRTELLNDTLTLVCAELKDAWLPTP